MKDIFSLKAPRINPNDDEMLFHGYSLNIGDKIKEGDIIATAETSKATFEIESSVSGKILELIFKVIRHFACGKSSLTYVLGLAVQILLPYHLLQFENHQLQYKTCCL